MGKHWHMEWKIKGMKKIRTMLFFLSIAFFVIDTTWFVHYKQEWYTVSKVSQNNNQFVGSTN